MWRQEFFSVIGGAAAWPRYLSRASGTAPGVASYAVATYAIELWLVVHNQEHKRPTVVGTLSTADTQYNTTSTRRAHGLA